MEKEFVPYELALRMKVLGFDEPCLGYYTHNEKLCRYGSNEINIEYLFCTHKDIYKTYSLAPTFSQAFRWFIENYGLWFRPDYYDDLKEYNFQGNIHKLGNFSSLADNTCEGAELACLEKIIEIVESENK
jgi:hypothetical protein